MYGEHVANCTTYEYLSRRVGLASSYMYLGRAYNMHVYQLLPGGRAAGVVVLWCCGLWSVVVVLFAVGLLVPVPGPRPAKG